MDEYVSDALLGPVWTSELIISPVLVDVSVCERHNSDVSHIHQVLSWTIQYFNLGCLLKRSREELLALVVETTTVDLDEDPRVHRRSK